MEIWLKLYLPDFLVVAAAFSDVQWVAQDKMLGWWVDLILVTIGARIALEFEATLATVSSAIQLG